jgi:hypothetical protein
LSEKRQSCPDENLLKRDDRAALAYSIDSMDVVGGGEGAATERRSRRRRVRRGWREKRRAGDPRPATLSPVAIATTMFLLSAKATELLGADTRATEAAAPARAGFR